MSIQVCWIITSQFLIQMVHWSFPVFQCFASCFALSFWENFRTVLRSFRIFISLLSSNIKIFLLEPETLLYTTNLSNIHWWMKHTPKQCKWLTSRIIPQSCFQPLPLSTNSWFYTILHWSWPSNEREKWSRGDSHYSGLII